MAIVYKIHPAIGIARVGDSEEFYLGPETAGGLPILTGASFGPHDFRDAQGRIRRQAARFRVFRYDTDAPDAPCTEVIAGQDGVAAIEWRVHVANKKAIWYQFHTLLGEDGYAPDHPLRNPADTDPATRVARIIDPGPRTLTGPDQYVTFSRGDDTGDYPATWPPEGLKPTSIDSLGQAHTDADGRLVFVGGYGHSGSSRAPSIVDYANNDDWWDDTSDGPVTATIVVAGGGGEQRVPVDFPAWVAVAPPGYAPQVFNLVTLHDTMLDVAVRRFGYRPDVYRDQAWQTDYLPDYATEIEPLLRRGMTYPWVAAIPPHAHKFDFARLGDPDRAYASLRQFVLSVLRPPTGPDYFGAPTSGLTMMPFLAGDNAFYPGAPTSAYLKLTDTQYFFLQQWANGKFRSAAPLPALSPGAALDRAVLENCVGGGFSPGIEMTWIVRNPLIYQEPFRLKHRAEVPVPLSLTSSLSAGLEPGDGCKYMALPWQADFNECSSQPVTQPRAMPGNGEAVPGNQVVNRVLWWWPAQRPGFVWIRDETRPLGRRQRTWVGSPDPNADDYIQFGDDLTMVERWNDLGFLYNFGTADAPEILEVGSRLHPDDPADTT